MAIRFPFLLLSLEKLGSKLLKALMGLLQFFRSLLNAHFQIVTGSAQVIFHPLALGDIENERKNRRHGSLGI